uniref:Oxidoreductase molybdopterin-binding domain-containing protein n=1 Tax=Chromera velia CCMP2878 TaxID=1169474 RepID=A0A0G4G3U1_9ALVE|eukprot:Cvel_20067.t1-p1 / transcript=Cvel_20067.t1 / gene=Cvel_20067 / organism=Chromera_velia_CCMP2878 / gene_product=Nitrate reductase [NADPH], putative / transcript_product=Nitrate reductase [NADPH], putative / location=Cvel_scaffold1775:17350-20513(+) / protein_length=570 / sequence_SO=supercontig / SO=protein_coding / is_pseudo=false
MATATLPTMQVKEGKLSEQTPLSLSRGSMDTDARSDNSADSQETYHTVRMIKSDVRYEGVADTPDDKWISPPRKPDMIRLTGKHPFNAEPSVGKLIESYITPQEHFYVRTHADTPQIDAETFECTVNGLVKKELVFKLKDLMKMPSTEVTYTQVCAGNRRKEQNMIKQGLGFSWGPCAVGTVTYTGVLLADILEMCGVTKEEAAFQEKGPWKERWVEFEGADTTRNGSYGTGLPLSWCLDRNMEVTVAYKINGEDLTADHGWPFRIAIPGAIGGRSVKWLRRITVIEGVSTHHWHLYDNKVFPPFVDANNVGKEGWWEKPEYAIMDLGVNGAICSPGVHECVKATDRGDGMTAVTLKGYAYSGGGHQVVRAEVSTDGGLIWKMARFTEERMSKTGKCWCWSFWEVDIEVPADKESIVLFRAFDNSMNVMPECPMWNVMGMMNNSWYRIMFTPTSDGFLRTIHPHWAPEDSPIHPKNVHARIADGNGFKNAPIQGDIVYAAATAAQQAPAAASAPVEKKQEKPAAPAAPAGPSVLSTLCKSPAVQQGAKLAAVAAGTVGLLMTLDSLKKGR